MTGVASSALVTQRGEASPPLVGQRSEKLRGRGDPERAGDTMKIRIRMEAYDHEVLDEAALNIVETAKRTGARVSGPVPLPTRIERYTVNRSPHVDKKSREQFELRTHKRVIDISEPSGKTMDALRKITMPAGVNLHMKA